MTKITEQDVENNALVRLENNGWLTESGSSIAPDCENSERANYSEVVLAERLRSSIASFNASLPLEAHDEAYRKLANPEGSNLVARNRSVHRMLVDGVNVEYQNKNGEMQGAQVKLIDFDNCENNDWFAVNQFTVIENSKRRRPDIVLFVNGMPLVVIELKNPVDEKSTIQSAINQFQTYKTEIPSLFHYNVALIVSDGINALIGTLTAAKEWFKPWRTVDGEDLADPSLPQIQVMIDGVCQHDRFLRLVRDYIVFDDGSGELTKKVAGYHQFYAVKVAVNETLRASKMQLAVSGVSITSDTKGGRPGDRRIGVVWHTQGSGKSLTMAFYAGRIIRELSMENPTIVVLTDRNDLDDQLFGTFARCNDLLRQEPTQAESRSDLRSKLKIESGGVIFTTIQKFFPDDKDSSHPLLSERRNIVVIADEAHRSQYDFLDGYARHMRDALPNASFIGFTGTPIEKEDANTRAVFGDYISVYDIQSAVEDNATVHIYYESRLAELSLDEAEKPKLDPKFEEITEGEEVDRKDRLKTRWAQLESIVGAEKRIKLIANDIVEHFKQRVDVIDGKVMIVCMSRRICVDLYQQIVDICPQWHSQDDNKGKIKVVMTGAPADPPEWQAHIRNKNRRQVLAKRFRDPSDHFQIVIVRDMWLTGFDAPSLHTMYIDKPMRGHGLMQTITRVNRVYRDKPGGLIVDYLGIANELKNALNTYTNSQGRGEVTIDQEDAVALMLEKFEICRAMFHGFNYTGWNTKSDQKLDILASAQEHILAQEDGKRRFIRAVGELTSAFALAVPHKETTRIRDDVIFFQTVRSALSKRTPGESKTDEALDHAVKQIISDALVSGKVIDIFDAAGIKKPSVGILSEEFLKDVENLPNRNLAVELLQKLLNNEISTRQKRNLVQSRSFANMLEETLRRYHNRAIETVRVIQELIELARDIRQADARGEKLGLSDDELAFYDALETNDSAVQILGDEVLCEIARKLTETVRSNVKIDWAIRENVRANLRRLVKRVLRLHGYPPDKQETATITVIEQAEMLSANWEA